MHGEFSAVNAPSSDFPTNPSSDLQPLPKSVRAEQYAEAHPTASVREIKVATGVGHGTAQRAKSATVPSGTVSVGLDGKVRKMPERSQPAPIVTTQTPGKWDDFNWYKDESIVVKEQFPIAVYVNADGYVVIRQRGDEFNDEDALIAITPENVRSLVDCLCDVVGLLEARRAS
jgi:hypothetical protein